MRVSKCVLYFTGLTRMWMSHWASLSDKQAFFWGWRGALSDRNVGIVWHWEWFFCACACKKRIMFVSLRERKCARLWGRDCVCVLTDLFNREWHACLSVQEKQVFGDSVCISVWYQQTVSVLHVNKAASFSAFTSAALSQNGSTAAQTCCSFFLYSIVSDGEWSRFCLFCFFVSKHQLLCIRLFFISTATKIIKPKKIIIIQETGSWGKLVLCTVAWLVGLQLWSRLVGLKNREKGF